MKTLIYFSSLTLLVFFTYSSCKQSSNLIEKDYSLDSATEIINNFNEGKPPSAMAVYKKASIEIVTTKKEIVLFVKEANKQDQMYVLQQDPSIKRKIIRETIASAEILFFHRHLLINSTEKDLRFYFSVDETIPNYLSNLNVGIISKGYGLVQQKGVKLSYDSIEVFHDISSVYNVMKRTIGNQASIRSDDDEGGGTIDAALECGCCTASTIATVCTDIAGGNCDAGGSGSTNCSISLADGSSCSSACSGGAESCCNDTSNDI